MKDIRLDIYVSAEMYLALRHVCEREDRSMSQHVRHLIRRDMESSVTGVQEKDCGTDAGSARDVTWGGAD